MIKIDELYIPSCLSQPAGKSRSQGEGGASGTLVGLGGGDRFFTGTAYRSLFNWPGTWGMELLHSLFFSNVLQITTQ